MSIDVKALAKALPNVPGYSRTNKPPELFAADLAAEYARLVPAEDEGRLREAPLEATCPNCGYRFRYSETDTYRNHRCPVPAEDEGRLRGVDDCINIVQQSLDTVRHEVSRGVTANPPYVNASIAAREHVMRLLTSYRARLVPAEDDPVQRAESSVDWESAAERVPAEDEGRLREAARDLADAPEPWTDPKG